MTFAQKCAVMAHACLAAHPGATPAKAPATRYGVLPQVVAVGVQVVSFAAHGVYPCLLVCR